MKVHSNIFCLLFLITLVPAPAVSRAQPVSLASCIEDCGSNGGFCSSDASCCRSTLFDELTFRFAIDGSKQTQDFGVNANIGGHFAANWGLPISYDHGLGLQIGSGITATSNAVRVFEILGEETGRTQSYTTVGLFQRLENGFSWGVVHDFLYTKGFDNFHLGQWRGRISYDLTNTDQVGVSGFLQSFDDDGVFGTGTNVTLRPIDQAHFFWRRFWGTGAQTTFWVGIAEGHGEDNIVTGFNRPKDEVVLFGADVLMPLNCQLALYGETNIMMPSDTGTVDAFLGVQWYPGGNVFQARRGKFSPLMTLASPVSFAVDLIRR